MSWAVCLRLSAALVVDRLTCRSHSRCLRRDSVSSVESMLRRGVRGDRARGGGLDVVIMMGCAREDSGPCPIEVCGDEFKGPLGEVVRERRMAGVERDAAFWSAAARSFSCIMLVS